MPNRIARRTRKKPQPRSFRPTTAMQRYLAAEKELLARRRPFTQKMVAELAHVSESQASRWHNVSGYDDWVSKELHTEATRLLTRAEVAAVHRVIMTGHPSELESLGRYFAEHYDRGDSDDAGGPSEKPYVFNVLIPRPPDLPEEERPVMSSAVPAPLAPAAAPIDPMTIRPIRPRLPLPEGIPFVDVKSSK